CTPGSSRGGDPRRDTTRWSGTWPSTERRSSAGTWTTNGFAQRPSCWCYSSGARPEMLQTMLSVAAGFSRPMASRPAEAGRYTLRHPERERRTGVSGWRADHATRPHRSLATLGMTHAAHPHFEQSRVATAAPAVGGRSGRRYTSVPDGRSVHGVFRMIRTFAPFVANVSAKKSPAVH